MQALEAWRSRVVQRDYPNSYITPSAILEDNLVFDIASYGDIASEVLQEALIARDWTWANIYGDELMELLEKTPRSFASLPSSLGLRAANLERLVALVGVSSSGGSSKAEERRFLDELDETLHRRFALGK